ncbi:MAG: cell division protein FtsQ/DivIB [Acutalibacteraceae bacterium]
MENNTGKTKKHKTVVKPGKPDKNAGLSRDEVRSINKKKMKLKRRIKKLLTTFILGIAVICAGIVLVLSLCFKINTITVKGECMYPQDTVINASGIETGTNLFRVNGEKVSDKLSAALPYIKSVTIERELPDTIVINVKSTSAAGAISQNGNYILIDSTGKVLDADCSMLSESMAVIETAGVKQVTEGEKIVLSDEKETEALLKLLSAIDESGLKSVTSVNVQDINDVELIYDGRILIKVGSLTDVAHKLQLANGAIEKENEINAYSTGILNLKIEDHVYFNAGSIEETTAEKPTEEDVTSEDGEKSDNDDSNNDKTADAQ